ncbi:hypothetical protein G6514_004545 [Epicoccum nigrum]|nr:hypothetical protein G6514_004545 [Epicoccum nigrum]
MSASTSTLSDCQEPTRNNDGATLPFLRPTGLIHAPTKTALLRPLEQQFEWTPARRKPAGLTGGGRQFADTVGAGSPASGTDGRKGDGGWEKGAEGLRTDGQRSLVDIWRATKASQKAVMDKKPSRGPYGLGDEQDSLPVLLLSQEQDTRDEPLESAFPPQQRPIFEGLCFFVNGLNGAPCHGGRNSIVLGRRTVTHVKEVARTGGKAIKYVTVEWVLESIKTGRRLPESRFAPLKLAHESQAVVLGTSNHKGATGTAHG